MNPRTAVYLAAIVALVVAGGCRRKVPRPVPAEPPPPAPASVVENPKPAGEPSPMGCTDDRSCARYLRCIDGECSDPPALDGAEGTFPTISLFAGEQELATYKIELAVAPWERTRGLMYRPRMHSDWGMLFIFEDVTERSFWMKNTLIPLDMVHLDEDLKVVGVVHAAEPQTTTPRQVGVPAKYVLELNAGEAQRVGIEAGASATLANLPSTASP